ncbi:MAG: sulfurtransferase TusA family protein [Desulfobulbus sp.]|jgi:TusA-related sulfurtransferase|nr:MAG: sulfurtransferase TusA family protein [Desulfobulbus sp.]
MVDVQKIELDILGQVCPACLLVVLREMNTHRKRLKSGEAQLVIKTDHRDTTRTIPESARKMGYDVEVRNLEGYYEITIGQR